MYYICSCLFSQITKHFSISQCGKKGREGEREHSRPQSQTKPAMSLPWLVMPQAFWSSLNHRLTLTPTGQHDHLSLGGAGRGRGWGPRGGDRRRGCGGWEQWGGVEGLCVDEESQPGGGGGGCPQHARVPHHYWKWQDSPLDRGECVCPVSRSIHRVDQAVSCRWWRWYAGSKYVFSFAWHHQEYGQRVWLRKWNQSLKTCSSIPATNFLLYSHHFFTPQYFLMLLNLCGLGSSSYLSYLFVSQPRAFIFFLVIHLSVINNRIKHPTLASNPLAFHRPRWSPVCQPLLGTCSRLFSCPARRERSAVSSSQLSVLPSLYSINSCTASGQCKVLIIFFFVANLISPPLTNTLAFYSSSLIKESACSFYFLSYLSRCS